MKDNVPEKELSFVRRIIEGELSAEEALQGIDLADKSEGGANRRRKHKKRLTKKLRRRAVVARLALLGYSTKAIANAIGVKPATVLKDMRAIEEEWLKVIADSVDKAKARELARIDKLEREYWEAWYRSIDAEVKSVSVEDSDQNGRRTKRSVKSWAVGKVEFLQGIERCIEMRIKILGLEAPAKVDNRHLFYGDFNINQLSAEEVSDSVLSGIVRLIAEGAGANGSSN